MQDVCIIIQPTVPASYILAFRMKSEDIENVGPEAKGGMTHGEPYCTAGGSWQGCILNAGDDDHLPSLTFWHNA